VAARGSEGAQIPENGDWLMKLQEGSLASKGSTPAETNQSSQNCQEFYKTIADTSEFPIREYLSVGENGE
jgi:hypothetical protein